MDVLYIHRKMFDQSGWFNRTFKYLGQKLKRKYIFRGRYGFFRASLHSAMNTTETNIEYVESVSNEYVNNNFDWLILNHEAHSPSEEPDSFEELLHILEKFSVPKALFIGHPHPDYLPPEPILDRVKLIFKREPYRDKDHYSIRSNNREKIVPTMLHCPFVTPNVFTLKWTRPGDYGFPNPSKNFKYDVYFNGRDCNSHRRQYWQFVDSLPFRNGGGLYEGSSDFTEVPEDLKTTKINSEKYANQLHKSRISLVLKGAGPFTHRHLETWCVASFMLSDSGIRDISLPFDFEEGKHYVSFDSKSILKSKIKYYLNNDEERHEIAAHGRKLFEKEYDFDRHGEFIKSRLSHSTT